MPQNIHPIRASIDIGSNSVLGLVIDCTPEERLKVLYSSSEITALGKNLSNTKHFLQESMDATLAALERCLLAFKAYDIGPLEVVVTATEASRVALNAKIFFEEVEQTLGLKVNIISPQAESYYTSFGVGLGMVMPSSDRSIIVDMGGGSTELIVFQPHPFRLIDFYSIPIGVQKILDFTDDSSQIENYLNNLPLKWHEFAQNKIFVVDGTLTSLAAIYLDHKTFSESQLHGTVIDWNDMMLKCERNIIQKTPEQLKSGYPYLGKRSETLKYGYSLIKSIFRRLSVGEVQVSCYGQRHATAFLGVIRREHLYERTDPSTGCQ